MAEEKKEHVLLFWSPRVERNISQGLWESDCVVDVPDDIRPEMMDEIAKRLINVLHEEISKAKGKNIPLRIIQLGPSVFRGILEHVLNTVLTPAGGELRVIKVRRVDESAPVVVLDDDTADKVFLAKSGYVDFSKPPAPDKRLYNDDLPATLEPPSGYIKK